MLLLYASLPQQPLCTPLVESSRIQWSSSERQILFNRIAPVYDYLNDLLTLSQHPVWKRMSVSWSGAKKGDSVLDLCCGSGDISFLLSEKVGLQGKVSAVDFSRDQLSLASSKQETLWKTCYKNIVWIEGDVLDLPFEDASFDAVTIGYGLHNLGWLIDNIVVPVGNGYGLGEEYAYLRSSIAEFLTGRDQEKMAEEVGFSNVKHYEIGGGLMGNLVATRW